MPNYQISERVISSEQSATVGIADKAKSLREAGETVYDFSAGRAFEPTPAYVVDAAIDAVQDGDTHQTMAKGTTPYRAACAAKLSRENDIHADPEAEIIATMGCKQGLTISLLALLNPGDEVLVEDPCFVSYRQTIQYLGGKVVPVPLLPTNDWRWTRDQLFHAVTSRTKAIIICSPHNPTGVVHSQEDLEEISVVAREHNITVIVDAPYERMTWDGRKFQNLANLPGMRPLTITLMSLTKSFSMGGWRVGFNHAHPTLIEQMTKLQQHLITCVSSLGQAGGVVAFGEPPREEVRRYWSEWEEKVQFFAKALDGIDGLSCATPEGGFYGWVDISALGMPSETFVDRLLEEEKVAVIPGASFGAMGRDYVRITCVKSWEEIHQGLAHIQRFVERL
ncbi:MAG: aminotransferase class I/II-fold pyridoxal phosphate-dependent enzyme [Bacteroidota bacterium]